MQKTRKCLAVTAILLLVYVGIEVTIYLMDWAVDIYEGEEGLKFEVTKLT